MENASSSPASRSNRANAAAQALRKLPERYRQLRRDVVYPVSYSERLEKLLEKLKKRVSRAKVTNRAE